MYNVGGSNLAIGISLIMRDRFTNQARTAGMAMDSMEQKAERLRRQQLSMARDMNATGAAIGAAAIAGMGQWYREGAKFGYTMKYVSTLGGGAYDQLSKRATQLGEDTIFTARQVSDGMRWMAQAGMESTGIYESIGAITELATATLTDIGGRGGAADWVTNLSKAFKIPLKAENIERLSNTIAKSVNKANLTLYDYGEAMKYAQSTASVLDYSLEETSAAIMVMANAGMQGTMAGVAFENSLRYFSKAISDSATGRQTDALTKLGLSPEQFKDARGNLVHYGEILKKVREASKGLEGNVAVQGAINDIFGVRGSRAILQNINSLSDYNNLLKEIQNSDGYAKKVSDELMGTSEGSILQLISTWESFKIKFAEAIEPMIDPLVNGIRLLITGINKLMSTSSGAKLAMIAAGYVAIRTIVMGYRAVVMSLRLAHTVLGTSAAAATSKATAGYNAATNAANRYATAAGRASGMGMAGGMGMGMFSGMSTGTRGKAGRWLARKGVGSYTDMAKNGALYTLAGKTSTFAKKGTAAGWTMGGMGKFGKYAGKLSLPAMLAGMGLELASDSAGGNKTGLGKGLGVAGDTLGWAGTGAMLGSVIPGIGTGIGAIIGGVGGLLYSLNERLDETADKLDDAKDKITSEFDKASWLNDAKLVQSLAPNQTALRYGAASMNYETGQAENWGSILKQLLNSEKNISRGDIIINIDGEKKFQAAMKAQQYKEIHNIGL